MNDHDAKLQTDNNSDFSAKNELFANEQFLKNYNSSLVKKITMAFVSSQHGPVTDSVLEFGAGMGALAAEYFSQNKIKPDCIEVDKEQIKIIQRRGFSCFDNIGDLKNQYDGIYTSNVLEHIKDDVAALHDLHSVLSDNGRIVIYVPAFMCLWSQMDEAVGHYRRYSQRELCHKVSQAGFQILSCNYADSVGFFASLYLRVMGYKAEGIGAGRGLKFYDNWLFPLSKVMDFMGCRYLFGKNLLLVAKK